MEQKVDVPDELRDALAADEAARGAFDALAPSHRREYADWVGGAKKPETRATRARKSVEMIRESAGRS